jgi:hypothetical protein
MTNQLHCKLRQSIRLLLGKSVLNSDILSFDPPKFVQLLPKRFYKHRATGRGAYIQETYAKDFSCLLRLGHSPTEGERQSDC